MKGDSKIYAYEVDGRGNSVTDFDDANSAHGGAQGAWPHVS